jgi:hypothetical protein
VTDRVRAHVYVGFDLGLKFNVPRQADDVARWEGGRCREGGSPSQPIQ